LVALTTFNQRGMTDEADWVVESECDLRVGGEWIIRFGPSSAPYVERNVFHTVERPHRLVYASTTEWPDGSHVESLMEIKTVTRRGRASGRTVATKCCPRPDAR
jgi:uncharacterized protein YndB with AHSA1/START domain